MSSFYNANPTPEELREWILTADKRNAILPMSLEVRGHYTTIVCGREDCGIVFTRRLLPKRNDPIYVCPHCQSRIYLPIKW